MTTETDFAKVLERLEGKIDSQGERLEQKIDNQTEKLQSIETRLSKVEEKTDGLNQQLEHIQSNLEQQENRLWTLLATTTVTLLGGLLTILGKFLLFPNK